MALPRGSFTWLSGLEAEVIAAIFWKMVKNLENHFARKNVADGLLLFCFLLLRVTSKHLHTLRTQKGRFFHLNEHLYKRNIKFDFSLYFRCWNTIYVVIFGCVVLCQPKLHWSIIIYRQRVKTYYCVNLINGILSPNPIDTASSAHVC